MKEQAMAMLLKRMMAMAGVDPDLIRIARVKLNGVVYDAILIKPEEKEKKKDAES